MSMKIYSVILSISVLLILSSVTYQMIEHQEYLFSYSVNYDELLFYDQMNNSGDYFIGVISNNATQIYKFNEHDGNVELFIAYSPIETNETIVYNKVVSMKIESEYTGYQIAITDIEQISITKYKIEYYDGYCFHPSFGWLEFDIHNETFEWTSHVK